MKLKKLRKIAGNIKRRIIRYGIVREALRAKKISRDKMLLIFEKRSALKKLLAAPVLLHDSEIVALGKYVQEARETALEIGAAFGGSSLAMLLRKNAGTKLYSIDPFVVDSMDAFQASEQKTREHVNYALHALGDGERVSDWQIIPDYSYNVIKSWQKPIDMIFIDGDHRYDAVKRDFTEWVPLVKLGGFVLFHDSCKTPGSPEEKYDKGWPGPTKLASELKNDPRVRFLESIHSLSVFQKI